MADDDAEARAAVAKAGGSLKFNYQKSPQYRTVHCDGAIGGLTPRGYISCTLYNERNVIPRVVAREIVDVAETGLVRLSGERIEDSLEGMMRQLEVTLLFDVNTAREFFMWFNNALGELEAAHGIPEADRLSGAKMEAEKK